MSSLLPLLINTLVWTALGWTLWAYRPTPRRLRRYRPVRNMALRGHADDFHGPLLVAGTMIGQRQFKYDSLGRLLPASDQDYFWHTGENVARHSFYDLTHQVASRTCHCGFYAYHTNMYHYMRTPRTYIDGLIEGYGRVTVGSKGVPLREGSHRGVDRLVDSASGPPPLPGRETVPDTATRLPSVPAQRCTGNSWRPAGCIAAAAFPTRS